MTKEKSNKLGKMQQRVLGGLAVGRNTEQLAEELELSEVTVTLIARSAIKALNVRSISAAVAAYAGQEPS